MFEDTINAPRGSVTAFISAVRSEDGSFIKIWYFKEESQASSVASQDNEQAGIRIVQGDEFGIITGKTTDTGDGLAQMNKDAAKLEALGFRVDVYTSGISDFELSVGANKGSMVGYLSAFRSSDDTHESVLITGYYFKTKADAKKCEKYADALVDFAIIRGDTYGYITDK